MEYPYRFDFKDGGENFLIVLFIVRSGASYRKHENSALLVKQSEGKKSKL